MSNDNTLSTANTNVTDPNCVPNIPVYHDGTHIVHDGNDATIALRGGAIHEIGLWSTREDRFETLLSHHAVSIKGRIYLDTSTAPRAIPSSVHHSKQARSRTRCWSYVLCVTCLWE